VPLLKGRHGDSGKLDNYRGITASSVISKVFELCVCSKYGEFLTIVMCYSLDIRRISVVKMLFLLLSTILHSVAAPCIFISSFDASKNLME